MAELDFSTIREFGQALSTPESKADQTKKAIVREVTPDGVVVEVGGSGVLTPVESSVATYSVGDVVQVTNRGGRLTIGGNATAPSVGAQFVNSTVAPVAQTAAEAAETAGNAAAQSESAQQAASEAQAVADATAQHFFSDTDGVHVTEAEQEEWTSSHTGKNILINSLGILLRNALNNLVSITASAIAFFDGNGNAASNVVAQFGASGAQIGKSGESHMELDYHSLKMVDKDTNEYFNVSDLRGTDGEAVFTDTWTADGSTKDFSFSNLADDTDYDVMVNGVVVTEGVSKYTAAVRINPAPANGAVVSVTYTSTSTIAKAYSIGPRGEGKVGASSVSIGRLNVVESMNSTAIGRYNAVNGWDSVAIGYSNEIDTSGFGYAIGSDLQVKGSDQLVIGTNNVPHGPNLYGRSPLFIIGNGELDTNRSNAFMVDWDGYIYPMDEKMPDWVVEQGTSGIWTYRKWHSGIAECWGNYTASIAVNNSSAGYGGYRSGQINCNLPSGLFAAWPTVTGTVATSQGIWLNNVSDTSKTAVKFYLSSGASQSAANRTVCFHCSGKWK